MMSIKFAPSLANARDYPPAHLRTAPKFRISDLTPAKNPAAVRPDMMTTTGGRGALGIFARVTKTTMQPRVLIPAYHCPALVEPFLWHDYQVVFYPVNPDLSVDASVIRDSISRYNPSHCVVVRFFGFNQNLQEVIPILLDAGIAVVEDCAHALFEFLKPDVPRAGGLNPAKICSFNKFLPTQAGGALLLPGTTPTALPRPGLTMEPKSIASLMQLTTTHLRRPFKPSLHLHQAHGGSEDGSQYTESQFRYYTEQDTETSAYRLSEWIFQHSRFEKIRTRRRYAAEYLLRNLDSCKAGRPLYPVLADEVPYVVPFLLAREASFGKIKEAGIQILRWEELAHTGCSVSRNYRRRLIQIPCHQGLSKDDLNYIVSVLHSVG